MRTTTVLFRQHVGRMIKRHWFVQGKIKVIKTRAEEIVKSQGYKVVDVNELLFPKAKKERSELKKIHPDFKQEPCYLYKDENVLLEGLEQAKVLTNTIDFNNLPNAINDLEVNVKLSEEIHSEIKKRIMLSCIYEASQQKLPKKKDPARPAFVFDREYGITNGRKNELLCKNLTTICEQFAMKNYSVVNDAFFSVPFEAHNKNIQFEVTSELAVTTSKKLNVVADPSVTYNINLPDLAPLDCTISLTSSNYYSLQNIYPFDVRSKYPFVQVAFAYFDPVVVKNIFEESVTETQIIGRSLLKAFAIAAAGARALYGSDILQLPEPFVVPLVQTDGKLFHFSIYQLNTLEIDKASKTKNIFWNSSMVPLYKTCQYKSGRPLLEEYNENVIRKLITFFNIE